MDGSAEAGVGAPTPSSGLVLATLLVLALLSATFVFDHGLWTPDEPRDAEIARETGFGLVPMLGQQPFLEKPPLYYWTVAASYAAFGVSPGTARIPSILFGCGTLGFTFLLARRAFGAYAGLLAALLLSTLAFALLIGHKATVDNALLFFTTGTFYFLREGSRSARKLPCYALAYVFALGAFLSKGPIGLVLTGPAFLVFLLWTRNAAEIWRAAPWLGAAIVGVGAALWVAALPADLRHVFLVENQVRRATGSNALAGHVRPFYHYLVTAPGAFVPWTLVLIPALRWSFAPGDTTEKRFFVSWVVTGMLLLSLAATKRELYLLPLFPAAAILIAGWFTRVDPPPAWARTLVRITAALLVLAQVAVWICAIALPRAGALWISVAIAISTWLFVRGRAMPEKLCFGAASVLLGALLVLVPAVDRNKDLEGVCNILPRVERLPMLKPDETTRAILPFYCGVWVTPFSGTEPFVLVLTRSRGTPVPPGYTEVARFEPERLVLFGRELPSSRRALVLAARDP